MSKKNKLTQVKEDSTDSYYSLKEKVDLSFKSKEVQKLYNETYDNVIDEQIADLKIKMEKPRNRKGKDSILKEEWQKHYDRINAYGIEKPYPFNINKDVMNLYDKDKDLYYDEIILKLYPETDSKKLNDIIISIATYNALWDFQIAGGLKDNIEDSNIEDSETEISEKEYTTARQVLAIYYLINELGLELEFINKTDLARFIQFITGKVADKKITNTNIYKRVKKIFNKNGKNQVGDLQFIYEFFKPILPEIAEKIKNDMNSYKKEKS